MNIEEKLQLPSIQRKVLWAAMHTPVGKSAVITDEGTALKVTVKKMPMDILRKIFAIGVNNGKDSLQELWRLY